VGIYNRAPLGSPPNWWISYTLPKELAKRFSVKRLQRDPAGSDRREAERLHSRRRKQAKDGTWRPSSKASASSTLEAYGERWIAGREKSGVRGVRDEAQRLRDFVYPVLGNRPMEDVSQSRADIKALVSGLGDVVSERTKRPLAPRTQRHVYNTLRAMFADAVADGVVLVNPCTLRAKRGELPKKKDANPRWRSGAVFTREEIEGLISDLRIPELRRVLYALTFLGGMRIGEAVARQWRDYDPVCEPLGRLVIATQHDEDELKTEQPREMPVHPTLARVLAEWKLRYPVVCAQTPSPDAHIVPNRAKTRAAHLPICGKFAWRNLQSDLTTLGLRRRRVHDIRRTFISLALADGADKYLLKFTTHGRPKEDAFDDYATPPWETLCAQVAKLKIRVRRGTVTSLRREA
jgi:integrase